MFKSDECFKRRLKDFSQRKKIAEKISVKIQSLKECLIYGIIVSSIDMTNKIMFCLIIYGVRRQ